MEVHWYIIREVWRGVEGAGLDYLPSKLLHDGLPLTGPTSRIVGYDDEMSRIVDLEHVFHYYPVPATWWRVSEYRDLKPVLGPVKGKRDLGVFRTQAEARAFADAAKAQHEAERAAVWQRMEEDRKALLAREQAQREEWEKAREARLEADKRYALKRTTEARPKLGLREEKK